jgi:hypothetical protein
MMRIVLFAVLATASMGRSAAAAGSTDPGALFPQLARLDLKNEGMRIWYPADKATPVKIPPAYLKDYEEAGVYASQPLLLDLGHGLPQLALACDSGPSADPSCRLLPKSDDPAGAIFESAGTDFVFLPNAEVYVFGHSDNLYDHRRLFRFDGKRFVEARQPYRYVGVEGKTTAALALTSDKGGDAKNALVTLAANTPVTILLNAATGDDENGQNADYLVRTREGLVGWARIPMQPDGKTVVEGLYFAGD